MQGKIKLINALRSILLCFVLVGCTGTDGSIRTPKITVSGWSATPSRAVVEGKVLKVTYFWEATVGDKTKLVCELNPGYGYKTVVILPCKGNQTYTHTYEKYKNYYVANLRVSDGKDNKVERKHSFLAKEVHEMLYLLNEARQQSRNCGGELYEAVPPLRWEIKLANSARKHSQDMADKDYFNHISSDGRAPKDRTAAEGYSGRVIGENISVGQDNYLQALSGWLKSPSHCKVIMDAVFKDFGAGHGYNAKSKHGNYWTQDFGAR